jgi:hypothetical protein
MVAATLRRIATPGLVAAIPDAHADHQPAV